MRTRPHNTNFHRRRQRKHARIDRQAVTVRKRVLLEMPTVSSARFNFEDAKCHQFYAMSIFIQPTQSSRFIKSDLPCQLYRTRSCRQSLYYSRSVDELKHCLRRRGTIWRRLSILGLPPTALLRPGEALKSARQISGTKELFRDDVQVDVGAVFAMRDRFVQKWNDKFSVDLVSAENSKSFEVQLV